MVGALTVDLSKGVYSVGVTGLNNGTLVGLRSCDRQRAAGSRLMGSDSGDTTFFGGTGADWIRGKAGDDVISGGAGADTFAYLKKDTVGGSVDTITDFEVGVDQLDMSDFMKGGRGLDAIRFADSADGTMVQGFVGGAWVDVVDLVGIDHATASHQDLGILV